MKRYAVLEEGKVVFEGSEEKCYEYCKMYHIMIYNGYAWQFNIDSAIVEI